MYISDTSSILIFMGYDPLVDFNFSVSAGITKLTWFHADPKPTEQAILDNELPWAISEAKSRVKLEGAKRIEAIYPFIDATSDDAMALYNLVVDLYLTTIPAAREAISGNLLLFKNIYDAAVDAIVAINAMTDVNLVKSYDAVNTPAWP